MCIVFTVNAYNCEFAQRQRDSGHQTTLQTAILNEQRNINIDKYHNLEEELKKATVKRKDTIATTITMNKLVLLSQCFFFLSFAVFWIYSSARIDTFGHEKKNYKGNIRDLFTVASFPLNCMFITFILSAVSCIYPYSSWSCVWANERTFNAIVQLDKAFRRTHLLRAHYLCHVIVYVDKQSFW